MTDLASMVMEVPLKPIPFKKGLARIRVALGVKWSLAHKGVMETIRWVIALYLNESPKYCWADLVTWSLGWHSFDDIGEACDCGYCGKCDTMTDEDREKKGFTKPRGWIYD